MLTPTLSTVEALLRKLERELYRAYHHRSPVHKADHFFNFCVTAHSLRDYFLERIGKVTKQDQQPFMDQWSQQAILVAVADIANSAKHFTLRKPNGTLRTVKTRSVRPKKSVFADVYLTSEGRIVVARRKAPDLMIVLSDGAKHDLYGFMNAVLQYWRDFLQIRGIRVRRQPLAHLRGA